jgi:hypothetical protein
LLTPLLLGRGGGASLSDGGTAGGIGVVSFALPALDPTGGSAPLEGATLPAPEGTGGGIGPGTIPLPGAIPEVSFDTGGIGSLGIVGGSIGAAFSSRTGVASVCFWLADITPGFESCRALVGVPTLSDGR